MAEDVLECNSGKCILYSRRCGSRGKFPDLAVKLLRIIFKWCSQELFFHEEKDLGKAYRSLWVLLFKSSLACVHTNMFLQGLVSELSSQDSA